MTCLIPDLDCYIQHKYNFLFVTIFGAKRDYRLHWTPLLELSKHRLAVHRKSQRKNGLSSTERRLVVPTDADIPGENTTGDSTPETADVLGEK